MWLVRTFRNSNDSDRQHLEAAASRPRQATDWSQPKPKSATAEREKEWERARRTSRRMFVREESDVSLWSNMQTSMYGNKVAPLKCPTRVKKESSGRERVAKTAPERDRERGTPLRLPARERSSNVLMHMCMLMLALAGFLSRALFSSLCTTLAVSEHFGLLASWT